MTSCLCEYKALVNAYKCEIIEKSHFLFMNGYKNIYKGVLVKLSIRLVVIIGCIFLVWGSYFAIAPSVYFSTKKIMLTHTQDIMKNISDLTLLETKNFFSIARSSARLTKKLILSEVVNTDDSSSKKLEQYFFDQLELHPQFAGIYLALPNGNFYYVSHNDSKSPNGYRTKIIRHNGKTRVTSLTWRDKNMNVILKEIDKTDKYDPRKRPWYIKAVKEKQIIWTNPYIFFTSKKPGITTAGPIYDKKSWDETTKVKGIVGVDIQLDELSNFISKLRVGKTGIAFMINKDKDVIAYPDHKQLKFISEKNLGTIRLPKLDELENKICSKAIESLEINDFKWQENINDSGKLQLPKSVFSTFKFNNKKYLTMATQVPESKVSWMIGLYIPEEDYFKEINANQKQNQIFALIISIIATIAGLIMARSITRPISQLAKEAQKIKNYNHLSLSETSLNTIKLHKVKSGFIEIQRTAQSFYEMQNAVINYKKELLEKEAEKIAMLKHLQQSQKMESIGTLAGGIAHDFNNLLFPIMGNTEILLSDIPKDSPLQKNLDRIYIAALRASELVNQILAFSRQDNTELTLMKIQPIIKETLKLLRSSLPATIEIKKNIKANCGVIKADPTQIHQIIMNLMTNAYHAMEDTGGELQVSLEEVQLDKNNIKTLDLIPGIYACITVADTGVGIEKDIIEKIFDPFFTTKEKGKGTGMGLSVLHGIITSMNGAVKVNSEPGNGSEFNIYLPVIKSAITNTKPEVNEKNPGGTEQILLIDDEESILETEKQMLERLGYKVNSYSNSSKALLAINYLMSL